MVPLSSDSDDSSEDDSLDSENSSIYVDVMAESDLDMVFDLFGLFLFICLFHLFLFICFYLFVYCFYLLFLFICLFHLFDLYIVAMYCCYTVKV